MPENAGVPRAAETVAPLQAARTEVNAAIDSLLSLQAARAVTRVSVARMCVPVAAGDSAPNVVPRKMIRVGVYACSSFRSAHNREMFVVMRVQSLAADVSGRRAVGIPGPL
jgi:hypothetical protein